MADSEPTASAAPVVVLVGAPNVGKSTLFNRWSDRGRAIVTDRPGITRDRIYGTVSAASGIFTLCDTGGLMRGSGSDRLFRPQADGRGDRRGLPPDLRGGRPERPDAARDRDRIAAAIARQAVDRRGEQIDNPLEQFRAAEFHRLGCGEPIPIAAQHGIGIADLLDAVERALGRCPPRRQRICRRRESPSSAGPMSGNPRSSTVSWEKSE